MAINTKKISKWLRDLSQKDSLTGEEFYILDDGVSTSKSKIEESVNNIKKPSITHSVYSDEVTINIDYNFTSSSLLDSPTVVFLGDGNTVGKIPRGLRSYWLNDIVKKYLEKNYNATVHNLSKDLYTSYKWMAGDTGDSSYNSVNPDPERNVTYALDTLQADIVCLFVTHEDVFNANSVSNTVLPNIESIKSEVEKKGKVFLVAYCGAKNNLTSIQKDEVTKLYEGLSNFGSNVFVDIHSLITNSSLGISSDYYNDVDNGYYSVSGQSLIGNYIIKSIDRVIKFSDNLRGFYIERSTSIDSGFEIIAQTQFGIVKYIDKKLTPDTYYYRVRALGDKNFKGSYSDPLTATVSFDFTVNVLSGLYLLKNTIDVSNSIEVESPNLLTNWIDLSIDGHMFTNTTTAEKPIVNTSNVQGDGVDDYLNGGNFSEYEPFTKSFLLGLKINRASGISSKETIFGSSLFNVNLDLTGRLEINFKPESTTATWKSNISLSDGLDKIVIISVNSVSELVQVYDINNNLINDDGVNVGNLSPISLSDYEGKTENMYLFARNNSGVADQNTTASIFKMIMIKDISTTYRNIIINELNL